MSPDNPIADDEIILRHIPGGTTFQAPGPRVTNRNFVLRHDRQETGVSVARAAISPPTDFLIRHGDPQTGSRVAATTAGDIRELGLEIVPDPLNDDPGHSEIRSAAASLDDLAVRRALTKSFVFLDPA